MSSSQYTKFGCLVYDKKTGTIKGLHIPVVLDLVTDRVRMRAANVAVFMMIFTLVALNVLDSAFKGPHRTDISSKHVAFVQVKSNFESRTYFGHVIPKIIVTLYDDKNERIPSRDVSVDMIVANDRYQDYSLLFTYAGYGSDTLDVQTVPVLKIGDKFIPTVEFIAARSVIEPDLRGKTKLTTNDAGNAYFTDLMVANGAPLVYKLVFCSDGTCTSVPLSMHVEGYTDVVAMANQISVNLTQPIRLTDSEDKPLGNRSVGLISFSFSTIHNMRQLKYGIFEKPVRFGLSDAHGLIKLSNEKVVIDSSTSDSLAFALCFEGLCTSLMDTMRETLFREAYMDMIFFDYTTDLYEIQIVEHPSRSVVEGIPLPIQPVLRLLDKHGNPVVGERAIAQLTESEGIPLTDLCPIPYGVKSIVDQISEPSDEDGYATFNSLAFGVLSAGNAPYRLKFFSGAVVSNSTDVIMVNTSVAHFTTKTLTTKVVVSKYVLDQASDFSTAGSIDPPIEVLVTNINNQGLEGKRILCSASPKSGVVLPYPGSLYWTEANGRASFSFKVTKGPSGIHNITCDCDGYEITVRLVVIRDNTVPLPPYRRRISDIQVLRSLPDEAYVGHAMFPGEEYGAVLRVIDADGMPIPGVPVAPLVMWPGIFDHVGVGETVTYAYMISIVPGAYDFICDPHHYEYISDDNGMVRFPNDSAVLIGSKSDVTYAFFVMQANDRLSFVTEMFHMHIENDIARAEFLSHPSILIEAESSSNVTVRAFLANGAPAAGVPVALVNYGTAFAGWRYFITVREDVNWQEAMSSFTADDTSIFTAEFFFPYAAHRSHAVTNSDGVYTFTNFRATPSYAGSYRVALIVGELAYKDLFNLTVIPRNVTLTPLNTTISTNGTSNYIEMETKFNFFFNVTQTETGQPLSGYYVRACLVREQGHESCLNGSKFMGVSFKSKDDGSAFFKDLLISGEAPNTTVSIMFWIGVHPSEMEPGTVDYGVRYWWNNITVLTRVYDVKLTNSYILPSAVSSGYTLPDLYVQVGDNELHGVAGAIVESYFLSSIHLLDNATEVSPLPFHAEYLHYVMDATSSVTLDTGTAILSHSIPTSVRRGEYYLFFGTQGVYSVLYGPLTLTDRPVGVALVVEPSLYIEVGKTWLVKPRGQVFVIGGAPLVGALVQMELVAPTGASARLDSTRTTTYTDDHGTAEFDPIIVSGPSGKYRMLISCDAIVSPISHEFDVINPYSIKITSEPDIQQEISVPLHPPLKIELSSKSLDAVVSHKAVKVIVDGPGGFKMNMDSTQYTNSEGVLIFNGLNFVDGSASIITITLDVDGATVTTRKMRFTDPREPDLSRVEQWTSYLWGTFIICIPLFFGNSGRQSTIAVVVGFTISLALTFIASIQLTQQKEFWDSIHEDTFIYVAMLYSLALFSLYSIFVLYSAMVLKLLFTKFGWRKPVSKSVYINDSYYLHRLEAYRVHVRNELPVGCHIHENALVEQNDQSNTTNKREWSFKNKSLSVFGSRRFYYPQRFLFGACLSIFVTFVEVLCVIILMKWFNFYLDGIQIRLSEMSDYVESKLDIFIGSLDTYNSARQYLDLPSVSASELLALAYVNSIWEQEFDRAQHYLTLSTTAAAILTFAVFIVIWVLMFTRYKDRILHMRHGDYFFIRKNFGSFPAVYWTGLQVAHCILGYALICLIFSFIIFICAYDTVRNYMITTMLAVIATMIGITFFARLASKILGNYVLMKDGRITHLRLFTLVDLALVFLQVLSGLVEAILRFIVVSFISILVYIRLDISIVTRETQHYDPGHASYVGMILMDHMHNNPILAVFCDYLISEMKTKRRIAKRRALSEVQEMNDAYAAFDRAPLLSDEPRNREVNKRYRNMWWLLVTLHNNPQLEFLRAHQLQIRKMG